jgi:hypothetical protein
MIGWIARSLARLALIDPQLLSPVKHGILRFPPTHDVSNVASRSSGSFRQHIGHDSPGQSAAQRSRPWSFQVLISSIPKHNISAFKVVAGMV